MVDRDDAVLGAFQDGGLVGLAPAQRLVRFPDLGEVDAGADEAGELAVGLPARHRRRVEPAILPVVAPQAEFLGVGHLGGDAVMEVPGAGRTVLRVQAVGPAGAELLLERAAGEVVPGLVEVDARPVGLDDPDQHRGRVGQVAEPLLGLPQLGRVRLQQSGHVVERGADLGEFVAARELRAGVELAGGEGLRALGQRGGAPRDGAVEIEPDQHAGEQAGAEQDAEVPKLVALQTGLLGGDVRLRDQPMAGAEIGRRENRLEGAAVGRGLEAPGRLAPDLGQEGVDPGAGLAGPPAPERRVGGREDAAVIIAEEAEAQLRHAPDARHEVHARLRMGRRQLGLQDRQDEIAQRQDPLAHQGVAGGLQVVVAERPAAQHHQEAQHERAQRQGVAKRIGVRHGRCAVASPSPGSLRSARADTTNCPRTPG